MSFDLGIWTDPDGRYVADPGAHYVALCETEDGGEPAPEVAALAGELARRWPADDPDDFEESPWASWPLSGQANAFGLAISLRYSAAQDVADEIVRAAHARGLHVYDPQSDVLHPPGGPPRGPARPVAPRRAMARYGVAYLVLVAVVLAVLLAFVVRYPV